MLEAKLLAAETPATEIAAGLYEAGWPRTPTAEDVTIGLIDVAATIAELTHGKEWRRCSFRIDR